MSTVRTVALTFAVVALLAAFALAEQRVFRLGGVRGLLGAVETGKNAFSVSQIDPFEDDFTPLVNFSVNAPPPSFGQHLYAMTVDAANGVGYTLVYSLYPGFLKINPVVVTTDLDDGSVKNIGQPLTYVADCMFFDPASSTLMVYVDEEGSSQVYAVNAAEGELTLVAETPLSVSSSGHTGCQYVPASQTLYTLVQDNSGASYSLQMNIATNTTKTVPIRTSDTVIDYVVQGGVLYVLTGKPSGTGIAYTLNSVSSLGVLAPMASLGTMPKFYAAGTTKMVDVPTNTYFFFTESADSPTSVQLVVVNLRTGRVTFTGDLSTRPALAMWAA